MERFISSSTFSSHPFPTTTPSTFLKVSSVRIEEKKTHQHKHFSPSNPPAKQPTTTTTTTTKTGPPKPINTPQLPSSSSSSPSYRAKRTEAPPQSFSSIILNAADDFINDFIDPPIRPSIDPKHALSNNFSPVDELPPTECAVVEGALPPCLDGGAYIRNGPNPQFLPRGPYHLFDGDGMLHCLCISGGRATLCSRYVKTNKYVAERDAASPVVPNVFSGFNSIPASAARITLFAARVLAGQFNPANGIGLANTSVAVFGGSRLFALGESDVPYEIRLNSNGDVETLGRHTFEGQLLANMTAHPKIDTETGEAFAFRVGPVPPFLTYFRISANGEKGPDVPIFSMPKPSFLHDFAITKNYAIFTDIQLGMVLNPGGSMVGADSGKVPRIGIIPRYARDESKMRWFEAPGFNIVHAINAWEDDDETITLVAPNVMSVEHTLERMELIYSMIEVAKVDMRTGRVWRRPVSAKNLDFAVINPAYTGRKNRYVYAAVGDPMPKVKGVVKLDLEAAAEHGECTVASRMYGEGCSGGEPFFVARDADNAASEEDDGYLVSYVHDEKKGESRFLVMDAKSPDLQVVAAVKLPQRVPSGFHGLFVRKADMAAARRL